MSSILEPAGHLGDRAVGATIHFDFNTSQATGVPFALAAGVVRVHKDGGTTEDDSGITLTADFDSRVGLNHVAIDTSVDATFFSSGGQFTAILTVGTVDSVSVVGKVLASFTLGIGVDLTRMLGVAQSATDLKDFADTGYDPATHVIEGLGATALASINAQALDVLNVDTFAQPGQGAPPATTTMRLMLAYMYKSWRNRKTQTTALWALYNDDGATIDQKAVISNNGVTAEKAEIGTGP